MPNPAYVYNGSSWEKIQGAAVVDVPKISEIVLTTAGTTITVSRGVEPAWGAGSRPPYMPPTASFMEVLLVGGGGGGGSGGTVTSTGPRNGGGGGAGGVQVFSYDITNLSSFTVYIGNGGAGGTFTPGTGTFGTTGENSTIVIPNYGTIVAGGGGGGGHPVSAGGTTQTNGLTGASSGGFSRGTWSGGGGGGAGSSAGLGGVSVTGDGIGNRGAGTITSINSVGLNTLQSQAAVTTGGQGINIWGRSLAGGGHGGISTTATLNSVSLIPTQFGAAASTSTTGDATANTGAGGLGGSDRTTTLYKGGSGASGICIIRYVWI